MPQNQFPAKYRFDVATEDCNSDYVVFGLTVTSGTQANLVGINNLYTGATPPCNSGSPWVAFAYNTVTQSGGRSRRRRRFRPTERRWRSWKARAGLHTSTFWCSRIRFRRRRRRSGTVLAPQTPTSCTTPTTVGCMTTLTIESAATNSNSSPWVDYNTDTAYVGADNGLLYKITPVFGGGAAGAGQ